MDLKEHIIISSFCVLILAHLSLSEHFELSSSQSVMGTVDQDAVLACQISLLSQPQNMEVHWKKIGGSHDDNIYQFTAVTGEETFGPGYQARAMLATKEGKATGNVSLKLKKIRVSDEGTYRCIVKSSHWVAETHTVLHITALGNVSIEVLGPDGEGIKLACKSAGWFPEPELQWLLKSSQNPQLESKQNQEQLFSVWSSITVLRDMGEITCSVHERGYFQRKREVTILLSRNIFPHFNTWLPAFWILFFLTLLAVGVAVYYGCKGRPKKMLESENRRLRQKLDFSKARKYQVDIYLDPECKHPDLEMSQDGRSTTCTLMPSKEATTSGSPIIVGTKGFHFASHYWEVRINDKLNWEVGVLTEEARNELKEGTADTKGNLGNLVHGKQYWSLKKCKSKYYPKEADHKIKQYLAYQFQVVGIYLEGGKGIISFCNITDMEFIIKFPVDTSKKLYPFFSPGLSLVRF